MPEQFDLAIIGAGPAGMAAAAAAASNNLQVLVLDEQPAPGGQIYRAITSNNHPGNAILGDDYKHGASLARALADPRITHWTNTTVWQVTPEREIFLTRNNDARCVAARAIIIATGATERPMPFPGWTLPGVMTAGAAQILLKTSSLVPQSGTVLAGSGPLLFLVAAQTLRAGGRIDAIVETTPPGNYRKALRHVIGAIAGHDQLRKGASMLAEIRRHGIAHFKCAAHLHATGTDRLEKLAFTTKGKTHEIACSNLLLHIGVVPNVQVTRSLNLPHDWNQAQRCWHPRCGPDGATELDGIFVAGDSAGIGGALAAETAGRIAGLAAARDIAGTDVTAELDKLSSDRKRQMAIRPFLDTLYAPSSEFLTPPDETVCCRCEEVTAGDIRGYVKLGCLGPNQTKSFGRSGMGPCQGRMCGLTVSELIANEIGAPVAEVGYYRIRPPLKPVTLGQLAAMHETEQNSANGKSVGTS